MWDLWWTEKLMDRFMFAYFGFPLSTSLYKCSTLIRLSITDTIYILEIDNIVKEKAGQNLSAPGN
jgi:hypothetical protein